MGEGEKRKDRDGVSLAFGITGPGGRPARRAMSSMVECAPDNCVVVPGLRRLSATWIV